LEIEKLSEQRSRTLLANRFSVMDKGVPLELDRFSSWAWREPPGDRNKNALDRYRLLAKLEANWTRAEITPTIAVGSASNEKLWGMGNGNAVNRMDLSPQWP
jgi:hypothetical protein